MVGAGAGVFEEGLVTGRAAGFQEKQDYSRNSGVQRVIG